MWGKGEDSDAEVESAKRNSPVLSFQSDDSSLNVAFAEIEFEYFGLLELFSVANFRFSPSSSIDHWIKVNVFCPAHGEV